MKARAVVQLVVEGRAPEGWASTRGVYGDFSDWPHSATYYVKCPKCGLVHGNFKSMRDAHAKKLCTNCDLDVINALKAQVYDVAKDPEHKPKSMAKIMGEAAETFDPFDAPSDPVPDTGLPTEPPLDYDATKQDVERLLLGNWLDSALYEISVEDNIAIANIEINTRWSERNGNYDPANKEDTTAVEIEADGSTFLLFKDADEAYAYAIKTVRHDLESEPEIFTQDWLKNFVNEERLKDAIGDPNAEWEDDVRNLYYEDLLDKMVEEGWVEDDDLVFFKQNGDKRIETKNRAAALNVYREDYIEQRKPPAPDPWEWLEDIYGREDAIKQAIEMAGIDYDAAAKSAVDTDGTAHFLAHYDHNERVLECGAFVYRTN